MGQVRPPTSPPHLPSSPSRRIELSDDSDIEVHPNVDKRSFINAMQRKKREDRALRKQQMSHYTTEIAMNKHLLTKLDKLITTFDNSGDQPIEQVVMTALMDMTTESDPSAPQPPQGTPGYAQMLAALVDTVKKEVDAEAPAQEQRFSFFVGRLKTHRQQLHEQTLSTQTKLEALEKEEASKITSDDIHEGFSAGHVAKHTPAPAAPAPKPKPAKKQVEAVEQLNAAPSASASGAQSASSGADADLDSSEDEEEHYEPTAIGREFARIKMGNYQQCLQFITEHPAVVAESETDGLLIEAFNAQIDGKADYSRQCVHAALLLQYCRSLGKDGVALFFKRITTPGHQAQKVFLQDVAQTHGRIRERAAEIAKSKGPVEQIQLHAVDPDTKISISIPEEGTAEREVFDSFPPGLRRALESESLEEVNIVLGKMSVEEAEEVVEKLGDGGMLSLEKGVVDATTGEGKKVLEEMERAERERKEVEGRIGEGRIEEVEGEEEPPKVHEEAQVDTKGKGKEVVVPVEELD